MKKVLIIMCCMFIFASCGTRQEQSSAELTMEEEQAVADSIANSIEQSRQELSNETKENLQEIDSLLENF